MAYRKPVYRSVVESLDKQTVERFLALCERNGAAEKVREYMGDWSMPSDCQSGYRRSLQDLGLTAILTKPVKPGDTTPDGRFEFVRRLSPPEKCARCGGSGMVFGDPDAATGPILVDCPACGGASDE